MSSTNCRYFADLEIHIKKTLCIDKLLDTLSSNGDIYCLTGRGKNWTRSFEFDFDSFCECAEKAVIWRIVYKDNIFLSLYSQNNSKRLFIIKGQEILTSENLDVNIVGSEYNFSDFINLETIIKKINKNGGFTILGHPYKKPNSFRSLNTEEKEKLREYARMVDVIEGFNQQLGYFDSTLNEKAESLAKELEKPSIAVSDLHFYRTPKKYILKKAGIVFYKNLFRWNGCGYEAINSLKDLILSNRYYNICNYSFDILKDFISINPRQLLYLYRYFCKIKINKHKWRLNLEHY
jgi:hypothetical protein